MRVQAHEGNCNGGTLHSSEAVSLWQCSHPFSLSTFYVRRSQACLRGFSRLEGLTECMERGHEARALFLFDAPVKDSDRPFVFRAVTQRSHRPLNRRPKGNLWKGIGQSFVSIKTRPRFRNESVLHYIHIPPFPPPPTPTHLIPFNLLSHALSCSPSHS